jgi:hypothetical protein
MKLFGTYEYRKQQFHKKYTCTITPEGLNSHERAKGEKKQKKKKRQGKTNIGPAQLVLH